MKAPSHFVGTEMMNAETMHIHTLIQYSANTVRTEDARTLNATLKNDEPILHLKCRLDTDVLIVFSSSNLLLGSQQKRPPEPSTS